MNNPWDGIKIPKAELSARRIDHNHTLDLFWARDRLGKYLFLCDLTNDCSLPKTIPSLEGIDILSLPETNQLVFRLKKSSDWELFYSLCKDIITATTKLKASAIVPVIFRRIERWREFLKNNKSSILPEKNIKGLIGELVYLKYHVSKVFDTSHAIDFWTGPEGSPQDFNIHDTAIEVKCQIGTSVPRIRISSVDQLCSQLKQLFLFVVTLGKTEPGADNSLSLPELIEAIKSDLIEEGAVRQLEKFQDILLNLGYVFSEEYRDYSYLISSKKFYLVNEKFPRLLTNYIPEGVSKVNYDIALANCEPFVVNDPFGAK